MPAFAACVEEAFINTDYIARRIGALTNHDLRRSLELSQRIITAPILKVDELVSAYFARRHVSIQERRIVLALLYGEYNKFRQEAHEFVLDVFRQEIGTRNSPLLRLSILRLMMDKENAGRDHVDAYLPFEEVAHYFESMGVSARPILTGVQELVSYRLIEPYEPDADEITQTTKLAITASGHMHFEMALSEPVYVAQMAQITAIRSDSTVRALRLLFSAQKMAGPEWTQVRKLFSQYCIEEDALLMPCPMHRDYDSQRQFRREFQQRWIA